MHVYMDSRSLVQSSSIRIALTCIEMYTCLRLNKVVYRIDREIASKRCVVVSSRCMSIIEHVPLVLL